MAQKRTKCSLAGQEGIQEDFLEEAGIPGGLELQRSVKGALGRGHSLVKGVAERMYKAGGVLP